ncbi:unnamed protein product, partial [Meganyctiphanes norvegica]
MVYQGSFIFWWPKAHYVGQEYMGPRNIEMEPVFTESLGNLTVVQGRNTHLQCSVENLGKYQSWASMSSYSLQSLGNSLWSLSRQLRLNHESCNLWLALWASNSILAGSTDQL